MVAGWHDACKPGAGTEDESGRERKGEWAVLTCDYNGWNDAPEDEREWFDQHPEVWGVPVRESDKRPFRVRQR
jgi:hypothetical protein